MKRSIVEVETLTLTLLRDYTTLNFAKVRLKLYNITKQLEGVGPAGGGAAGGLLQGQDVAPPQVQGQRVQGGGHRHLASLLLLPGGAGQQVGHLVPPAPRWQVHSPGHGSLLPISRMIETIHTRAHYEPCIAYY